MDLDVGAGDPDLFDDEAQESLASGEVEVVDAGGGSFGEGGDATAELVAPGQFAALLLERGVVGVEAPEAGVEVFGAALEFVELDEPGLVEVDEPAPFGVGGVGFALEPGEFGGEEFVVGGGAPGGDGGFPGGEGAGAKQCPADVVEDEVVEGFGPNGPFRTATLFSSGAEDVVVGTVVVELPPVGGSGAAAGDLEFAGAAADKAAQQPPVGGRPPGTEFDVGGPGLADGVEDVVRDEGGDGDEDPLLPGAGHLAFPAPAGPGNDFGLVVVQPPDVGLVAQDASHRGGPPRRFAGRGGNAVAVESDGDGPDGVTAGHVVVEDAPDHCEAGRLEDARELFKPLASRSFELPEDLTWLGFITVAAEVVRYLGDRSSAAVLYERLSPYSGVFSNTAAVSTGCTDHYLGMLAAVLGRYAEAEEHFRDAAAVYEMIGAPAHLGRTFVEWARMLLARQQPGDADRARQLLDQALAAARELGLVHVERRAVAVLSQTP